MPIFKSHGGKTGAGSPGFMADAKNPTFIPGNRAVTAQYGPELYHACRRRVTMCRFRCRCRKLRCV